MSKIDYSRIFIKEACPTSIGGQAVMEGVMMQGPDRIALAMRLPSGELYLRTKKKPASPKVMKVPFVRGIVAFAMSLVNGMSTLMESADILEQYAPEEYAEEPGKFEKWINDKFGSRAAWNFMMTSALLVAVLISVVFFVILPTWFVNFLGKWITNAVVLNLIEGILRIAMFVGYVAAIRNMEDIKTLFRYHGAEHKTIHCFENGLKLTPEKANIFYTLHPRCGTSFMVFVLLISLLLFSLLGWPNLAMRIISRLLLIPVIAGISYELLKWAGRSDGRIVKILSYPGLMLQKLTTAEPTLEQLEVAILSLKAVLVDPETADIDGFVDSNGKLIKVAVEDDVPDFAFSNQPKDEKKKKKRRTATLSMEEASEFEEAIAKAEQRSLAAAAEAAQAALNKSAGDAEIKKATDSIADTETTSGSGPDAKSDSSEHSENEEITVAPEYLDPDKDPLVERYTDPDLDAVLEAELFDDNNSRFDEYIRFEDLEGALGEDEELIPESFAYGHAGNYGSASDTEKDAYRSAREAGAAQDQKSAEANLNQGSDSEAATAAQKKESVIAANTAQDSSSVAASASKADSSESAGKSGSGTDTGSEAGPAAGIRVAGKVDPIAPVELAEPVHIEEKLGSKIVGFFKDLFKGEKETEEDAPDMEMWLEGSPVMSNKLPQEEEPEVSEESINEAIRFLDSIDHDGYTIVTPENNDGMTLAQSIAEHDAKQAKQRTLARRYTNDITTIENALEWGQAALSLIDNGRNEAVTIMSYATGLTRTELITRGKELMREEDFKEFDKRIQARLTGTPLQYILGMQEFMGLPFRVNPSVLIPRQDTEVMVEKAIDILNESDIPHPDVLDMCTGSGAIGISIAAKVPNAYVTMSDASQDALHTAMSNAGLNGVNRRCIFLLGDMFDALPEFKRFDMIVCNPPYIKSAEIDTLATEIKDHEPRMALDGGEDGLDYYRIIANHASEHLRSGGILLLEIGSDQAGSVKRLLMKAGTYRNIDKYKDLAGLDRVIIAERI